MKTKFNFGVFLAAVFSIAGAATSFAQSVSPRAEFTIPAQFVRALLPADGEVVSQTIRSNVWPQNASKGPFLQNETAEFALGLGIRAKPNDPQKPMLPGVKFRDGFLALQGGWRVHKVVPKKFRVFVDEFFDGPLYAYLALGYAGGEAFTDSEVAVDWNPSLGGRIFSPVTMIVLPIAKRTIEGQIEKDVRAKLPAKMDEAILKFLADKHLPTGLREFMVADIVPDGLRIRLYDDRVTSREVKIPSTVLPVKNMKRIGGADNDFGGNGPKVEIEADLKLIADKVVLVLRMHARETKSNWTECQGEITNTIYTAASNESIVGVLGPTHLTLADGIVEGHDPVSFHSFLGRGIIYGDSKTDNDVGGYTHMELEGGTKLRVITTKK